MGDGTLIQWGSETIPSGTYNIYVTLSQFFVDTSYIVVPHIPADVAVGWSATQRNQVRFGREPNTQAVEVSYIAIGRWK